MVSQDMLISKIISTLYRQVHIMAALKEALDLIIRVMVSKIIQVIVIYDSIEVLYKLLESSGQPDIYHYDFAGHSGKFYIHPENQQIILIDKKENITFERSSDLTWIAKTQDGNVFKFGIIESADGGINNEYTGRTYKLSNITFSNSKTITFSYIDEKYLQYKAMEYKCLFCTDGDGFLNDRTVLSTYQNKKTLSKIITADAIIDFNLEDREDIKSDLINNPVKRLKSNNITSGITKGTVNFFLLLENQ
jgi:hypothetical protein